MVTYFGQAKINETNPDRATYLMSNLNTAVKHAEAKTAQTGYSNETHLSRMNEKGVALQTLLIPIPIMD